MKLMGAFGVWAVFTVIVNLVVIWLVLSLAVSGVRAFNHACDQRWVIDRVTISHLFCPEESTDNDSKIGDGSKQQ